jgi:putative heme-binding domain-containing protein
MFSAATCILCHRFNGQGSTVGPDLSALGQRFTLRDILDSTLNPSKAISDQYRVAMVTTTSGRTHSGRIVSQDAESIQMATNLMRPTQAMAIDAREVEAVHWVPVSTMPSRLLNTLNEDELLDLLAYLISGGSREHPVFKPSASNSDGKR